MVKVSKSKAAFQKIRQKLQKSLISVQRIKLKQAIVSSWESDLSQENYYCSTQFVLKKLVP